MSQRVNVCGELKTETVEGEGKPSLKRAPEWHILDTKPCELTMARTKVR